MISFIDFPFNFKFPIESKVKLNVCMKKLIIRLNKTTMFNHEKSFKKFLTEKLILKVNCLLYVVLEDRI